LTQQYHAADGVHHQVVIDVSVMAVQIVILYLTYSVITLAQLLT